MRWTANQEKALIDMIKQNVPIDEVAKTLRRSVNAIRLKAKRMSLPFSSALQVSGSSHPSSSKASSNE